MNDSGSSLPIYRRPKDAIEETKSPSPNNDGDDNDDGPSPPLISDHSALILLGISDDDGSLERERVALFASAQDGAEWNEDGALQRIKWMMRAYRRWMNMKEVSTVNSGRYGFVEAVTMGMTAHYQFTDLLADFRFILKAKEVLIEDEKTRAQSETECNAADCFILRRSEREKKDSNGALKEWFFVDEDSADFDDKINDAVYQELLDSIHIFMEHTVRISPEELQNIEAMKLKEEKGVDDEDYDHFANSMCSVLEEKKKNSSRFRDSRRGGTGHKFITTTAMDTHSQPPPTTMSKSTGTASTTKTKDQEPVQKVENQKVNETNSVHKEPCFVDALCVEIEVEAATEAVHEVQSVMSAVNSFVDRDGGDTDAVIEDLEKVGDSNILGKKQDANAVSIWSICQKFIAQTTGAKDVYSSGWRYFYWPLYADNDDEERVVYTTRVGNCTESNPGYKLKDWFIPQKYRDLKEEALHNRCCPLSLLQWKMVAKKAEIKLNEWNKSKKSRKLLCNYGFSSQIWKESYGIADGTPISLAHVIAILMYCNYTEASYEFSRTFRKISAIESDRVLKQRHSEVSIWGKLLREAIECFGERMGERPDLKAFYHGVSREMVFPGTSIKLNGPVSTTLDFGIASGSFGADGIVVDIRRANGDTYFWDCEYWSDFHEEAECLFLGGLVLFNILTIRHIPSRKNYRRYIVPMNMLAMMLTGYASYLRMATERDVKTLSELINGQIAEEHGLSLQPQTDGYILGLFQYFCVHLEEVVINLDWMRFDHWKNKQFGYKIFRSLFFLDEDDESLNIQYFLQFLPKLKHFVVLYNPFQTYDPSLSMTDSFMNRLVETIQFANGHKTLSKSFKSLIVVEPKLMDGMDRESFVMRYQSMFAQIGWKIENTEYTPMERGGKGSALKFEKLL